MAPVADPLAPANPVWPPPPPVLAPVADPLAPADPVSLDIPVLAVHTGAIVPLDREPDGSMQVPDGAHTAGWYTGAPTPGALGPAVLIAHVDWMGEQGLFYDLARLAPGDTIPVGRADGSVAVFQVTHVEHYPKDAFPTEAVYGTVDYPELRLITCGGDFDEQRASYRDNVVAFAEMVNAQT